MRCGLSTQRYAVPRQSAFHRSPRVGRESPASVPWSRKPSKMFQVAINSNYAAVVEFRAHRRVAFAVALRIRKKRGPAARMALRSKTYCLSSIWMSFCRALITPRSYVSARQRTIVQVCVIRLIPVVRPRQPRIEAGPASAAASVESESRQAGCEFCSCVCVLKSSAALVGQRYFQLVARSIFRQCRALKLCC